MSCHSFVQNHTVTTLRGENYHASLPTMSEAAWNSILDYDSARRLEWIGDAVMAGRLSLKVYEMFPNGQFDFYTVVRSYVLSNLTFTHLMQTICDSGVGGSTALPSNKSSANIFESIVGAFYKENKAGHEFNAWFDDTFTPLIQAAEAAFRG
ncbi:hypothetical protein C8R44DRAFT_28969 [Mycena epipterygia]|nr:hypothetical protein C8R44DRAFT_28969 [Mycena epipterygia]